VPLQSSLSPSDLAHIYLSACDFPVVSAAFHSTVNSSSSTHSSDPSSPEPTRPPPSLDQFVSIFATQKKKYKPVAKKVRPIPAELPNKFRIVRNITSNPLADIPTLNPNPPPFQPTGRYTEEHRDITDKAHPDGFLWHSERDLMHDFMCKQEKGFAWNDQECCRFCTDFFPPVDFPTIPHTPWIQKNIAIPPGIYDEVCRIIHKNIDAGVYK